MMVVGWVVPAAAAAASASSTPSALTPRSYSATYAGDGGEQR
jgi:hypothetical protein